jgi:hypothetical protein
VASGPDGKLVIDRPSAETNEPTATALRPLPPAAFTAEENSSASRASASGNAKYGMRPQ